MCVCMFYSFTRNVTQLKKPWNIKPTKPNLFKYEWIIKI